MSTTSQPSPLVRALRSLAREFTNHPVGRGPACFVERLARTLDSVDYLFSWPQRFTLEGPFAVDPDGRRQARFADVWLVEEDRRRAQERLSSLAPATEMANRALVEIYQGNDPLVWQRSLVQRRYYERLISGPVAQGFEVSGPTSAADGLSLLDWAGLSSDDVRFVAHWLELRPVGGAVSLAGLAVADDLDRSIKSGSCGPLHEQLGWLKVIPGAQAVAVTRAIIGPAGETVSGSGEAGLDLYSTLEQVAFEPLPPGAVLTKTAPWDDERVVEGIVSRTVRFVAKSRPGPGPGQEHDGVSWRVLGDEPGGETGSRG